ncbi:RecT family recombinase [Roseinatronobacter sp.]|uniref:RecT family recombinase n=1 Tax=Roseinatronobacter sp. TaxID=1945755 RepID=UPI0025ECD41B|nr:RecT family recombinase [Roseibaca sp.]
MSKEVANISPIQSISKTLDSEAFAPKIAASLDGTGISPERFKRAALAALSRPEAAYLVEKCNRQSIYTALMNAAAAGLELHPALGQAYLVPRGGEATLQIGYRGLIALAARSGLAVEVDVIFAGDKYSVVKGTSPEVRVEPEFDAKKKGEWVAVYCITHYASGAKTLTFMTRAEVEALRDRFSDAYKRGGAAAKAWRENPEEMAKKTAIRRAAKLWPVSVPGDDENETVEHQTPPIRDVTPQQSTGGGHLDELAANL